MPIRALSVEHIRNLTAVSFTPSPHINIIYGDNGSGKTSLLEALHFLGLARSFRTHQFRYLVSNGQPQALVFAQADTHTSGTGQPLGVSRTLTGECQIRYSGNDLQLAELASLLPLQVINTDTFALLEGSPGARRQFIDWGVFHAEPTFIRLWRACRRALQQRNSLLKCGRIDAALRQIWDREFIDYAQQITTLRRRYIEQLQTDFSAILAQLDEQLDVTLSFAPGWDSRQELDQLLAEHLPRDLKQGFTGVGPQRADLRVKADGVNAAERLSRGQKKQVVSALKLAQGTLFHQVNQRACVYLIDDLPAELDSQHRQRFCRFLEQTRNQCFITCVDPASLSDCWHSDTDVAYFHMQAGQLRPTY